MSSCLTSLTCACIQSLAFMGTWACAGPGEGVRDGVRWAADLLPDRQHPLLRRCDPAEGRRAIQAHRAWAPGNCRDPRPDSSSCRHCWTPTPSAGPASRPPPTMPVSGSSAGCTRSARPRCGSRGLQALSKPFLHLHTQYGADLPYGDIDMDFMNLNQSAHGDREFAYLMTRLRLPRKIIAGHWADPVRAASHRRLEPCLCRRPRGPHTCASSASATTCARWPTPMVTRSRCRRGSGPRSTPTRSTSWSRSWTQIADAEVERLCAEYDDTYDRRAAAASRWRATWLAA